MDLGEIYLYTGEQGVVFKYSDALCLFLMVLDVLSSCSLYMFYILALTMCSILLATRLDRMDSPSALDGGVLACLLNLCIFFIY